MGALKDIYDIFSEETAKMKARRLKQSEVRSPEELEAYTASLESRVEELQAKVGDLEREHAAEVAGLKSENAALVQQNAELVALNEKLKTPRPPQTRLHRRGFL